MAMLKKLSRFIQHRNKDFKPILLSQNHCNINQRNFTKWKKLNSCSYGSICFNQYRKIGNQSIPTEIKSPYRVLEIPDVDILELMWDKIDRYPDHTAIVCGITGRKYTFAQIRKLSKKFAVSLLKSGICPGQTVAIVTQNCPEYPVIVFGCLEAGLVVTLINHMYTVDEIYHQLKDSDAACVVTAIEKLETIKAAVTKVKKSNKSIKDIKLLVLDVNHNDGGEISSGVGRFSELVADFVDPSDLSKLRNSVINTSNVAVIPYSSGTTGLSKGVQLSHSNLVSNILQMAEVFPVVETTKSYQDVIPGILPFYHMFGFNSIMLQSIHCGRKVVTLPKFEKKSFLEVLKNQKCNILCLVPPMVLFLGSEEVTTEHLQHVRSVVYAAAPIGVGDVEKCLQKVPKENNTTFEQAYGLTECTTCLTFTPKNSTLSSVGAPLSNTMIKVVSVESGENLGPNQDGEVCAKGPQVMLGYLNNPKATAATIDSEGWFHTGDIGHYDENGLLYIVDRIKELIKVKGFQVSPAELEELLRAMPGVKDAGVVGIPDKRAGEVPIAFVVQSSTNPATMSDIKSYLSQKVAHFKQLSDVVFVDAIPKSPSGKILRRIIREIYLNSKSK